MRRLLLLAALGCAEKAAPPTLEIVDAAVVARVPARVHDGKVTEAAGRALLRVTLADASEPVLGSYTAKDGVLTFRAAWPAAEGATYVARAPSGTARASSPALAHPTPRVLRFLPESSAIPANAIKLHVVFDQRMREDVRCELFDRTANAPVVNALRELPVWSADGATLTLLFHPGRQKRDIGFAQGMGPILEVGHRYELRVLSASAATGAALAPVARELVAAPDDRAPPDPARWTIRAPRAGTLEPLVLEADEPLDALTVASARVDGVSAQRSSDLRLTVTPRAPWIRGAHELTVSPELEDLAGNVPGRAFDHPAGADPAMELRRAFTIE